MAEDAAGQLKVSSKVPRKGQESCSCAQMRTGWRIYSELFPGCGQELPFTPLLVGVLPPLRFRRASYRASPFRASEDTGCPWSPLLFPRRCRPGCSLPIPTLPEVEFMVRTMTLPLLTRGWRLWGAPKSRPLLHIPINQDLHPLPPCMPHL